MDKIKQLARNKLGQYTKYNTPQNPFKKGNIPWNKHDKVKFKCLCCGIEKEILYGYRHRKFCSRSCKSKYLAKQNCGFIKTQFKPKKVEECTYKGKEKTYKHKWYLKNKERLLKKTKERYEKNKKHIALINKKWKEKNKEKCNFIRQQYKHRKRSAEGSFSFEQWEELKKKHNYKCVWCKKAEPEIKLEADHIIPLSKNGTNYISNIQPLCRSCNSSKGSKLQDEDIVRTCGKPQEVNSKSSR